MSDTATAQTENPAEPAEGAPVTIDLITSQTGRAAEFYTALFGWSFTTPFPEEMPGFHEIKHGSITLGGLIAPTALMGERGADRPSTWQLYLKTADATTTTERAVTAGANSVIEPNETGDLGTMSLISTPFSGDVGIWQPGAYRGFSLSTCGEEKAHGAPVWFELMSTGFDQAVEFFRDVFSWDIQWMSDGSDGSGFRYVTHGTGVSSAGGVMDAAGVMPEGAASYWRVYFNVDDIHQALEDVQKLGGSVPDGDIVEESPFGPLATAIDPTGAGFLLIQTSAAPA